MTRINRYRASTSLDEINEWGDSFLDNGWLDVKHGKLVHVGCYSVDIEEAVNIVIP